MAFTPAKGTKLQLSIASVFTDIAQVTNIGPPKMKMGKSETTHLQSDWKTFIASNILDGGEATFSIEHDPNDTTHSSLWTKFKDVSSSNNQGVQDWKVLLVTNPAKTVAFSGIITDFAPGELTMEGLLTAELTIQVSGAVTIS
jgi:hypothetical protein